MYVCIATCVRLCISYKEYWDKGKGLLEKRHTKKLSKQVT